MRIREAPCNGMFRGRRRPAAISGCLTTRCTRRVRPSGRCALLRPGGRAAGASGGASAAFGGRSGAPAAFMSLGAHQLVARPRVNVGR